MEKIKFKSVDNDKEVLFSVIDKAEISGEMYLLVTEGEYDEDSNAECYIMKAVGIGEEELTFDILDSGDELDAVAKEFERRLDEEFQA